MEARLFTDTSNFTSISNGDIILIGNKRYLITGHERERRFGIDDPKLWVKRAIDSDTGEKKIIKLSFFESFDTLLSGVKIKRFRNPKKEGDILDLVRNHQYFMQGKAFIDPKGNNIRVLDIVSGPNLFIQIDSIRIEHEAYFYSTLPGILKNLIKAFKSIHFLHNNGFKHGDIRSDHIIVEKETGNFVWIDFDYDYDTDENPFSLDIFEIGNILLYVVGKGFYSRHMIENNMNLYRQLGKQIEPEDFSILHKWRFINLKKLYPYIPTELNDILKHFSVGAEIFYESVGEIILDLERCVNHST